MTYTEFDYSRHYVVAIDPDTGQHHHVTLGQIAAMDDVPAYDLRPLFDRLSVIESRSQPAPVFSVDDQKTAALEQRVNQLLQIIEAMDAAHSASMAEHERLLDYIMLNGRSMTDEPLNAEPR